VKSHLFNPSTCNSYTLFLDEILPSGPLKYFCLAGIIVRDDIYQEILVPRVNQLKQEVFGTTDVILHEKDILKARTGIYSVLQDSQKKEKYWDGVREIFSEYDFKVVGVAIDVEELKKLYVRSRKDKYEVAMKLLLENYVNFLDRCGHEDAKGSIIAEARNNYQDSEINRYYYALKHSGTLFYAGFHLRTRLNDLEIVEKNKNVIGLQIADMIPNPLNRYLSKHPQRMETGNLINLILDKAYDGCVNRPDRFGIKVIP